MTAGLGVTHDPPKISMGMERGVPARPEATGRGCGHHREGSGMECEWLGWTGANWDTRMH